MKKLTNEFLKEILEIDVDSFIADDVSVKINPRYMPCGKIISQVEKSIPLNELAILCLEKATELYSKYHVYFDIHVFSVSPTTKKRLYAVDVIDEETHKSIKTFESDTFYDPILDAFAWIIKTYTNEVKK
jgi:hypothetical protein